MIAYRQGGQETLSLEQFTELYKASTLGERRPVEAPDRMKAMLTHGNLLITAWDGDLLVGVARSLTDFRYVTYLADLAVRASHQRKGIGRELVRQTRMAVPETLIVLLAAPAAVDYYPHIGFEKHNQAWILKPGQELTK